MIALSDDERALLDVVRRFVVDRVRPVARSLDHADAYPAELVDGMRAIGLFGLVVPAGDGGTPVSTPCFALVTEELASGWMSLAGVVGSHSVVARMLAEFGTAEQRARLLPAMATGELRAATALTEPGGGSDLQAIRTTAVRDGDGYRLNGTKTWITNGARAGLLAVLCRTDPAADPAHRGMSVLLVERDERVRVSRDLPKLGYRGVESSELYFDDVSVPATAVLGGAPGAGFAQMMRGLELGRVQVAARAVGVARAALDDSLRYAQLRESFGRPIWQHQSVGNLLADMAARLLTARLVTLHAAERVDAGGRCDLEAGVAKLVASEACLDVTRDALRIHASAGYSTELDVERYYRDAPLMVVGEGTNEIQRLVIARRLVERGGLGWDEL